MTCAAVPASTTTLKNGDLSIVFHVPAVEAADAFRGVHPLLGKQVHIDIYDMGED